MKKEAPHTPKKTTVRFVQKSIGEDTYTVMASSGVRIEDEFEGMYYSATNKNNNVLEPPYEPKKLASLVVHNNTLSQCVEAMEVNIDGTGFELVPTEEGIETNQEEYEKLKSFLDEPYPGQSFIQIRRKLRRDMESVGYGFLEVLRNLQGDVVAFRNVDSFSTRFVRLDEPVQVTHTIMRDGKETQITLWERERRFVQKVGNKKIYYKEFGASRELNINTGEWGENLDPKERATELLYFNINPDIKSPYGLPRWVNQIPSVIGSRKAEEQNLEFFDAGGMPPAIIFIQGGELSRDAANQLNTYLAGKSNKNRAVVVETSSTSGTLESAGDVKVHVEKFGSSSSNDAMYAKYDNDSAEHVRTGFRLPPMFLGKSQDYNYATAVISYMIAEEQVFQPERTEFDERINKTLVKALGVKTWRVHSKPITLKTAEDKFKAISAVTGIATKESIVEEINLLAGTSFLIEENGSAIFPLEEKVEQYAEELLKDDLNIVQLAHDWGVANKLLTSVRKMDGDEIKDINEKVASLEGEDLRKFQEMVTAYAFNSVSGTTVDLVSGCMCHDH